METNGIARRLLRLHADASTHPDRRREFWSAASVNARLPRVIVTPATETEKAVTIAASLSLDRNQPVERITWAPGKPRFVRDQLISNGGWFRCRGKSVFNLYRPPPAADRGNPALAGPWLDLVRYVFPDEAEHILDWFACRAQRPGDKINHALVLGGAQRIGKDSILAPVRHAVGDWNWREASPALILGTFNGFAKAVILRINEAHDLGGEINRYQFYNRLKNLIAAPPECIPINEKFTPEYYIPNVCGVIITTNHKTDGIFLAEDDGRHFVAWSERRKEDQHFAGGFWEKFHKWLAADGANHVAAYLHTRPLDDFDAKAPPPAPARSLRLCRRAQSEQRQRVVDHWPQAPKDLRQGIAAAACPFGRGQTGVRGSQRCRSCAPVAPVGTGFSITPTTLRRVYAFVERPS
jgi:hypothetical protein